jgi:hypothetical protein
VGKKDEAIRGLGCGRSSFAEPAALLETEVRHGEFPKWPGPTTGRYAVTIVTTRTALTSLELASVRSSGKQRIKQSTAPRRSRGVFRGPGPNAVRFSLTAIRDSRRVQSISQISSLGQTKRQKASSRIRSTLSALKLSLRL